MSRRRSDRPAARRSGSDAGACDDLFHPGTGAPVQFARRLPARLRRPLSMSVDSRCTGIRDAARGGRRFRGERLLALLDLAHERGIDVGVR